MLRYPLDLVDQSPHYIIFYPLVREGSLLGQSFKNKKAAVFDTSEQMRVQTNKNVEAGTISGAQIGVGIGAGLGIAGQLAAAGGKNAAGVVLSGGAAAGAVTAKALPGAFGAVVGGAIGAGTGAAVTAISGNQQLYVGAGGIALQMPENKVSSSYKATWREQEMGTLLGAVASGNQSLLGAFNPASSDTLKLAVRSGAKLVKSLSSFDRVLESTTKTVANPYKEQFFKSMDNRSFVFEYNFAPRSEAEAKVIFNRQTGEVGEKIGDTFGIIQKFAYHMHPELMNSGYFFNYPSEFSIVYYHAGKENTFLRKISTCVLTNMSVDYGSDTGFTTFDNGMPTHATIRLEFLELELMTSQRVKLGF